MLHRGKWLLMDANRRQQGPKGRPEVGAPKGLVTQELLPFYKLENTKGSLSRDKPTVHIVIPT